MMNKDVLKKIGFGIAGAILIVGSALGVKKATKKEYVKVDTTPSDEKDEKEEQKEEES